jgi:endonuclease YncB( thermonuclease family)
MARGQRSRSKPNARIRRPARRRWLWLAAVVALGLVVIADRSGWLLARHSDDLSVYDGVAVEVVRVIDGDTLEIGLPDALHDRPTTRVRLCGIDCPETARPGRPAEPLAEAAADLTRHLVAGKLVVLRLEPDRTRGAFGRVLAHVQLPDGGSLNERLLEAGLAVVDERSPHAMLVRYAQVENTARRQKIGLWSEP